MAVPEQTPYIEYTANGSTNSFDLGFYCKNQDHLIVKVDDAEPSVGSWSLNSGAVVFGTAPTNGKKITIQRNTPILRLTNFQSSNNSFRPEALNEDLDRVWLRLQEEDFSKFLLNQLINMNYEDLDEKGQNIRTELINKLTEQAGQLDAQIVQQGVALNQLEGYNSYLMQRLTQVAVDRGWDASFVADGDTNQKQINDKTIQNVNTIDELKTVTPRKNGQIVFVKGFRSGSTDGNGNFEWDSTSTETVVEGFIVKTNLLAVGRFKRVMTKPYIDVLDAGAYRNGLVETHTYIKAAQNYAIKMKTYAFMPSGNYLWGGRDDPTIGTGDSCILFGESKASTFIIERPGLTTELGRFNMSIYFLAPDGVHAKSMIAKGFSVIKNGKYSPASSPTDYIHEQSHAVAIASGWNNSSIEYVEIDVDVYDKTGGGVVLTQGLIHKAKIYTNGRDYQHIGGQRGDFEFQAVVVDLEVISSTGPYTQCEPNIVQPPNGIKCKAVFRDCNFPITELTAYSAKFDAQTVQFVNHDALNQMTLRWCKALGDNVRYRVGNGQNEFWDGLSEGSYFSKNCEMIIMTDTTTNATKPFYLKTGHFIQDGGKVSPDFNFNATTTTGFAIGSNTAHTGAVLTLHELNDVIFDSRFERSLDAYGNGIFKTKRCKLAARGPLSAIRVGGYLEYYSTIDLEDNDLSQLSGPYVQFTASNTLWSANFKGTHDYSKSNFNLGGATTTATVEACVKADGIFYSNTVPTNKGVVGWRVKINKPVFGYGAEYIATATSPTAAAYQLSAQNGVKSDTTANRPTGLTVASRGLRFFDTTLAAAGKPVQYNGSAWVDNAGIIV